MTKVKYILKALIAIAITKFHSSKLGNYTYKHKYGYKFNHLVWAQGQLYVLQVKMLLPMLPSLFLRSKIAS